MSETTTPTKRRVANVINVGAAVALLAAGMALRPVATGTQASSHREAPLISNDPQADTTDIYAFVSPDRPDTVTLIGSWNPFEGPEGGPNYTTFGDDLLYTMHIDNDGDALADVSYEFDFHTTRRNGETFLYNTGPVSTLEDTDLNVRQFYTVTQVVSTTSGFERTVWFGNKLVPPVNIGSKSTPNYAALADAAIYSTGTGANEIKVFAGQTDDPFFVDLGSVFDLLSLRGQAAPVGYASGTSVGVDGLSGYNVHSIVLQVPIASTLVNAPANETVIGVWMTTHRPSVRTIGALNTVTSSGPMVQVSRLGMPLVNEVVIPLALKDAFNSIPPSVDVPLATGGISGLESAGALLLRSVLTPELQTLLKDLYAVPNPGKPRADIFDIFLTGMEIKQPFTITTGGVGGTPTPFVLPVGFKVTRPVALTQGGEMLRLNTAVKGNLCHPTPQRLGVLAGDACGFPNGRRLADDVTEIELLAVAGAAWRPLTNDNSFSFNPALIGVLTDSVDKNDLPFRSSFPYLAYPHQGQEHYHAYINRARLPVLSRAQ
jgi:hypothetical protein